jgi:formate dehydrogenase subunit delta
MVHNANQISLFFESYPREEAIEAIANHLRQFWVPRMRRQIIDYVEKEGGEGLRELAVEAAKRLPAPVIR